MTFPGAATPPYAGGSTDFLGSLRIALGPEAVRHIETLPRRTGRRAPWPTAATPEIRAALERMGIVAPWQHQVRVAELALGGSHVVVATGTASGKSLGYQLPILCRFAADPDATALYLSPTKALAADQLEWWRSLPLPELRPAAYDGDTAREDRIWARDYGRLLLTNPDMVHYGILPHHERWRRLLRHLQFIVVDECHYYRGVFGSHVALVLRRLRRLAAHYGADPVVVCASATVANPQTAAARLVGAPVVAVTDDGAPHAGGDFALVKPELSPLPQAAPTADTDDGASAWDSEFSPQTGVDFLAEGRVITGENTGAPGHVIREGHSPTTLSARSITGEAARIMAQLVAADARVLTFARSRAAAEVIALACQRVLGGIAPHLETHVAAYRGGYLPEDRRELERAFESGELRGVAATNALELGVDISGIDAVVIAGYPGTLASLWQQSGRAGRAENRALTVFIAREDPLDSYLVAHPEAIFARPVEAAMSDPTNPYVLGPHLACAAAELPLTGADIEFFGADPARTPLKDLLMSKAVRQRPGGIFYAGRHHPAGDISLRSSGGQVAVVEADTGRLLGTEDAGAATARVHPGAVYLHQGRTYSVDQLDLNNGIALVHADQPGWSTMSRSISTVEILATSASHQLDDDVVWAHGQVRATEQVIGYSRRAADGTLLDTIALDMPEQQLDTHAVWYTLSPAVLERLEIAVADWPGTLHAAEHAAIGILPLLAGCDRSDIGGLSTALHADTGRPTVIVYDGLPGGAGFAERGFAVVGQWMAATFAAISACGCPAGCPSCIQSPKCGNGNNPLDKAGALQLLDYLAELGVRTTGIRHK